MFFSFFNTSLPKNGVGQTVMSYTNFGRGRGFGRRGSRATASSFGRPRFLPPPFRHVGPPRPGRPFMPWQPNNMFFQPHLLRGNPQFRPGGRRKNFCGHNTRSPARNRLPVPPDYEDVIVSPDLNSLQIESSQIEATPQIPLPGSEEERQQKIAETADRLKQKLSCFSSSEMRNIWSDDKPFSANFAEDDCINDINIAEPRYQQIELTSNDLTNIEKVNPDDSRLDNTQYISNDTNNTNTDMVILEENENESQLATIPNDQMTNLCVENEYLKMDNWLHEPVDNLEQSDLHKDHNVESGLLDSDLQCQFNTPLINISQDCCDQQQDISQENEIYPTSATIEQDVSKTSSLQNISLPTDLTDQDILQTNVSPSEQELVTTNLEVQENILESQVPTISSSSNNCTLSQSTVTHASVLNNITSDNQVPKIKKNSFHSGPPKLSPHTEQGELPVDFDPSTPPPILVKQDESRVMPPPPVSDVLPLFNPTEPPPNFRHLLKSTSKGKEIPMWNNINVQNSAPTTYNRETYTELNTNGGFISQQLPLESQSNVFLPPHIDTIQFSPRFSVPSGSCPVIDPNVSSHAIFPTHAMSHNTYAPSSPSSELLPLSDCNTSKDDGLNDMQEALKFAKQMTSITEKREKESSSKSLCESSTIVNSISNVESISLPPGEPKTKTNTLKKTKRNDIHNKKISQEQRVSDHLPLEEITVQDARSMDMSLINEQERPKVVFNLNNKTKIVTTRSGWRENTEKRNGIKQFMESEKTPSISKKNFESTLKRNEEERKNLKKNENNSGNTASSESIANQNTVSSHKKIQKNANVEKSLANISLSSKINMQKSTSYAEKNENSTSETSWKNKIISRFLKMSKNDIFNMVNNTSLRKFDVIMKRLVKEKKSSLSLEMRHAENEKMKLYDQQEFMKQLNTMLETDATVSVTDLPTEFIHHLNEVLQLDVQLDNQVESATAATSSSQNSHLEDPNHVFSPVRLFISEYPNRTTAHNYINQECERNKGHMKTGHDRDAQMHHISRSNDFNLKDDTCSTIVSNKSSISSKLSALQHDLDDIFSEVTKKNQTPAAIKERKYCSVNQRNAKKFDDDAIARSAENDTPLEDDRMRKSENCARWIERCDKWKRKEREDPHAYRNLTKEEWEARYGTQADSISSSSFTKKINTNKNPSHRGRKKSYPRRRHSSESSKHIRITRHRTLEKDKHKKSRRHSDDRRHSAAYSEYNNDNNDRNEDNSSSSSSSNSNSSSKTSNSTNSSSSSSSNDSNGNTEPNVTKLLRAIKEKEKVAKKMSLNETIRDEVNAEIERERKQKSRKSRKYKKWRKEKKLHHKKKKKKQQQSKKTTNSFDSASDKDDNEEITKLLTENEIKKETMENEITQEVIVKEELDISQEENTRDAEFANASSRVENKTMLPESNDTLESSLLTTQETPLTTVNQPYIEDRPPTASPTQPKTKAQLKQMPEAADTNDNKIFLKIFTTLPEDWNTINPTECSENSNKSYQVTDINCNRDETEVPAIDNFTSNIKNCEHLRESSNENAISRQSDVCTSSDSFINPTKIKGDTNTSISANISDKAASTSAIASDVPIMRNVSRKSRGASKKIDIKTYYERTIHRRMNVKEESKKFAENPTTSTQDLSSSKIVKPEIPINKSTSILTYDGSIQDPRLFSAARLADISCQINSKDNEIPLRNDVRQEERQTMKTSKITKLASKSVEENLNRVTDTGSIVEKINQDTSKDKHPLIANTNVNVLSNVTTNTISSKSNTGNVMDKKLQSRVASDSKKFKNIRSEGSKELKLKKEITKPRKTKKKPGIALKSISLLPTKIYYPLKTTENANEVSQEEKIDSTSDNRMKIEQITNPCESKINNNCSKNAEMKVSTIFSENTDNNNELSQGVDEAKESFSSLEFNREENTEKDVGNNIEATDSPETMRNEEPHNAESANNTASIEVTNKEEQNTREIFNVVSKPNASAASIEISTDIVKVAQEDTSTSDKEFNATKDATEFLDQIQVEKSNNQDRSESMDNPVFEDTLEKGDMSSTPELDMTPRPDIIDDTRKDQPLINKNVVNDVEINDSKENTESIVMDSTCKSAEEDNSLPKKTVELSSASIGNSTQRQDTGNGVISPESVGSPFKGFLPETMIDFEQPDLFNLELHEKDKLFLNDCNVNHATREEEAKIAKQRNYESLECSCANNMGVNENFNVTFGDTLLASDKERATSDKSGLMADGSRQGQVVGKSSCEIVTSRLHEDDNIEGDEADKGLISESQLTIKDSMFINEEEMIQDENGSKDLTSKLTTTTDPSLSDALDDAAISDDALRLAENQSAEHLNNHNMYLEANISTEKISCDKLPGFDSDEHLDNDMFYLDDRLQSAGTFDNKDEASFSIHRETSPRFDIIPPTVTPEPTMITSCADLSPDEMQEERYKFDLKPISSTDGSDLLARVTSMEHSPIVIDTPRTLNIPTKAALKEAASHFLKSNHSSIKETTQISEKTQQSETDSVSYQTPAWHVDIYQGTKTHSLDTHTNNCVNVNTISSTENNTHNERVHTNMDVDQSKTLVTSPNNEKGLRSSDIQYNPVVELRKMKELDSRMTNQKKTQEKPRDDVYKDRRKRNGTLLHKLKNKRQMKYRSQRVDLNRNSLTRKLKNMKHFTGAGNSREAILARMLEIDLEMQKLTTEKLKLHEMLQSNVESVVTNNEATRDNDMISDQTGVVSTLTSQNAKINSAKRKKHHSSSSKQSPIKRKKIVPRSLEDDEITRYTQKKMPVIKWKKTPRLEYMINRQEEDLEEENNLDETEQPLTTFANKEINISPVLDTSEDATIQKPESNTPEDATTRKPESNAFEDVSEDATIQKLESNATIDHDVQVQGTTENHEKANCDVIDESLKPTIDRSSLDKSADNHTEDSAEREHAKCFDIDKRDDFLIPRKPANSQPASVQLRSTPESLSIYSDDSTWNFLAQNTASEVQENRNVTGLVLLDEKLKKEQARSRKLKAIVRKKKKEQLNNYLKRVNNLTMEEEELPLSKLYIRKLRQKRDLLDSLSLRKEDANIDVDPEILKNVDEVINAVAENRVEDLYEPQTQNVSDIPTTSNLLSQPEEHQFYVDAEAANSDWPCREKENIEEAAEQQQDSNNAPANDESNHVFKVVNQNKTPFHDEHNVEPDSSVTPEETLIESHPLDCDVPPKDNVALRNFDIRVSVPKILIKDDFSLGLLQKFKDTEGGVVGTGLVDSTTNVLATNSEKSMEKNEDSLTAKSSQVVEEDKGKEESETNLIEEKDKAVDVSDRQNKACELQKDETINNVRDTQNAPQSNATKSEYTDTIENEDTGDSVASNNKITMANVTRDSSVSDPIVEKVNAREKKSDTESEQLSCDAIALKQDSRDGKNANAKEKERSDPESGSRVFEAIMDNENTRSSVSIDRASEKSEESTDTSVDQRSSLERAITSAFSFDKITAKSMETSKSRSRKKSGVSTPVRRSTRYTNENVKPSKMSEVDSNSNSSEQLNVHERDLITQSRSRSPSWTMRDEKILNNIKRNRAAQKTQSTANRKVSIIDCEAKIENQAKSHLSAEPASSKNKTPINAKKRKHTEWQMMNCKVKLTDCKHTLFKQNVNREILDKLGIIAINPSVSSDISHMQRATYNQDMTVIPAATLEQSSQFLLEKSCDKRTEIEILEEKPIKQNNDDDSAQGAASMEVDEQEEAMKMQYTVHKGPILDIKVNI